MDIKINKNKQTNKQNKKTVTQTDHVDCITPKHPAIVTGRCLFTHLFSFTHCLKVLPCVLCYLLVSHFKICQS